MRRYLRTPYFVGSLFAAPFCVAGCMQTTASNSPPPPPSDPTGGAATFTDVFRPKTQTGADPAASPKVTGGTLVDSADTQPNSAVIYDQKRFGEGEKIVERNA